jgi:LuxR family transcriptional regulator, activator of tox operons
MRMTHAISGDPGTGPILVRPEKVGAVVRAIGTAGFARALAALIDETIAIEALHLEWWHPRAGGDADYAVEWFGSWTSRDYDLSNLMQTYYREFWHDDPLMQPARAQKGTLLLLRDVGGMADGDLRRRFYDEPGIVEECMLVRGDARNQYALSLTRSRAQGAFGMNELFGLRRMVEMVFPMFESHVRASGARRPAAVPLLASEDDAFDTQLARQNIHLSQRERELCRLLLSRWSVPDAASQLDIKLSTAKTYVGRAFAKLGVNSRKELFDWAHGGG